MKKEVFWFRKSLVAVLVAVLTFMVIGCKAPMKNAAQEHTYLEDIPLKLKQTDYPLKLKQTDYPLKLQSTDHLAQDKVRPLPPKEIKLDACQSKQIYFGFEHRCYEIAVTRGRVNVFVDGVNIEVSAGDSIDVCGNNISVHAKENNTIITVQRVCE